jgi:hypothetical protein
LNGNTLSGRNDRPGEVVVAEKIDRINRLPLAEAQRLVASIRSKGARLAVLGLVDLSEFATAADGAAWSTPLDDQVD